MDSDLPVRRSLADVVDLCGMEMAVALVAALPGTEIYVPQPDRLGPDHVLTLALGLDQARALAGIFGGDRLLVTRSLADQARVRRRTIREMKRAGSKVRDIALGTGCTERFVRMVTSAGDGDDGQGSLF